MIQDKIVNILSETISLYDFEKLLKQHDWYYEFSDDYSIWSKGNLEKQKLRDFMKILFSQGKKSEAIALWNKYAPKEYKWMDK